MVQGNSGKTHSNKTGTTTKKRAAAKRTTGKATETHPAHTVPAKRQAAPRAREETKPRRIGDVVATDEQIRSRAYEIYLARSGAPGDALSDWVQAERELREQA